MQHESTNAVGSTESNEAKVSQWCLVYEKQTGNVVHIHQFFPLTSDDLVSKEQLEEAALSELDPNSRKTISSLGLFHPDKEMRFDPRMMYNIDLTSNSISGKLIDPYERISELKKKTRKDEV